MRLAGPSRERNETMSKPFAHPEVLVDSAWLTEHAKDPKVVIAEVDYDPQANYHTGHIPGAVLFDWKKDINDGVKRDIIDTAQLQALFRAKGIHPDSTLVLYGDFNNWFAAYAFWVFKYHHVDDVRILNGGRKKWIEEDKPLTKNIPTRVASDLHRRRARPRPSFGSTSTTCSASSPRSRTESSPWSMSADRRSSRARSRRLPSIRTRRLSAGATFRVLRTSRGPRPSRRTGRSRPARRSRRSTRRRASPPTSR